MKKFYFTIEICIEAETKEEAIEMYEEINKSNANLVESGDEWKLIPENSS